MKKNVVILISLVLIVSFTYPSSFTGDTFNPKAFELNWVTDSLTLGAGLGFLGAWKLCEKDPVPFDGILFSLSDINSFDRWAAGPYNHTFAKLGDVSMVLGLLTPSVLMVSPLSEWPTIGLMYIETVALSQGIKELTKSLVGRPRPYMYFEGYPLDKVEEGDYLDSFPSGHTTTAFCGATFTSYVFSKYYPDSKWKIPVIAASYTIAVSTGIMRMLSGNHFLSDVLAGAVLASACGFVVPWLHSLDNFGFKKNGIQTSFTPLGFYCKVNY